MEVRITVTEICYVFPYHRKDVLLPILFRHSAVMYLYYLPDLNFSFRIEKYLGFFSFLFFPFWAPLLG